MGIYMEIIRKKVIQSMDVFTSACYVPKPVLGTARTAGKKISSWLWSPEGHCVC